MRFYVTMTWHGWPEGGSYGTVVEASSHDEAEQLCIAEMLSCYAEADKPEEWGVETVEQMLEKIRDAYAGEWHLVDCFVLDEFIENHRPTAAPIQKAIQKLKMLLGSEDHCFCSETGLMLEEIEIDLSNTNPPPVYVIVNDDFDDQLFWSNKMGWVSSPDEDFFPNMNRNLPIGGRWVRHNP